MYVMKLLLLVAIIKQYLGCLVVSAGASAPADDGADGSDHLLQIKKVGFILWWGT